MKLPGEIQPISRPPLAVSILAVAVLASFMALLRFIAYPHEYVPIGYGLALVIALWHRHRPLHYATAALFLGMIAWKYVILRSDGIAPPGQAVQFGALQILNVLAISAAIDLANRFRDQSEARRAQLLVANANLARSNHDLEAVNEELTAREEEITRQNEEMQAQAEEITRQNEELQAQAEELESQAEQLRIRAEEISSANVDLERREAILTVLLQCAGALHSPQQALEEICHVAGRIMGGPDGAAGIVFRAGEDVVLRTWTGAASPAIGTWDYASSFASIVMERNQTAALFDLALRPDIILPAIDGGSPIRSVLATPYRLRGQSVGVFEVYRRTPYQFTDEDFRTIEWLSAQCSLILEMLSLHEEIAQRRQDAEEVSRRKTQFLAAVSHDIRTPANAITLISELIRRLSESDPSSREIPRLASDLQSTSRSMVELVSDVLDLTRFDSGGQELNPSEFPLRSVLEAEVRQFLPTAKHKGLSLALAFEDGTSDLCLHTDRLKLARVLNNLIGNALKFTDVGSVEVLVRRETEGAVRIEVIDTGVGIPPEDIDAIFDEFHQLRNPERDRSKGTGLGLAICRRLVQALDSRLTVESEPGRGSCFRIHLPASIVCDQPAHRSAPRPARSCNEASAPDGLAGVRVLLVEDHDTTRRSTTLLLQQYGATVIAAAGGRAAFQALLHQEPDVLLLDLMLPDMDGTEVLRRLPHVRTPRLRCVLAVTGDARPERVTEVLALGADGIISKPIEVDHLVARIEAVLARGLDRGAAARSPRTTVS